jgi:hypothetical protein
MPLLVELSGLLGPLLSPWKEFGTVLKGELKRTVINMNTFLQLTLGPTLAGADYAEVMRKNKEKINKIDQDVNAALDKIPLGAVGKGMLFVLAPGPSLFKAARDVSGVVTPEAVDKFMDEYGFKDLAIGRIPVGRIFTDIASKGARLGGFATLNRKAYEKTLKELEDDADPKWYTPIERILLLQNPFGPKSRREKKESRAFGTNLLLEADETADEQQAFLDFLKMSGFENKYMNEVGIPYVEAKEEIITGLVDLFEKDIEETSAIATAQTFEDFIAALSKTTIERYKQVNAQTIKADMEKEVQGLLEAEEELSKFAEVAGITVEELKKDEKKAKEFLAQKIYEKEFTEMRINSINSISDAIDEIKEEVLGDYPESDLDELKINPLGKKLYTVITDALNRLKKASSSIENLAAEAKKLEDLKK